MRTLPIVLIVAIGTLAAGSVLAENTRQDLDPLAPDQPRNPLLELRGHATLSLSPMYLEIHRINEASAAAERELLARLAASREEAEVGRLVQRLQRMDSDRRIAVLQVRVRYARLEGRYDLAFRLRQEVLHLLQKDVAALM